MDVGQTPWSMGGDSRVDLKKPKKFVSFFKCPFFWAESGWLYFAKF